MTSPYAELTKSFEARDLNAGTFRHLDHVGVAYEMLRKYDFLEAAVRYGRNINIIATKASASDKFNTTITFAFMSLIAERMATTDHANYDDFTARNQDLLSKDVLKLWYSPDRLRSDLARKIFLMPDNPR
ncbi:MAG: hypothetical protein ACTSX7_02480 [Alphaproteobacteria bacterium]